MKQCPDCQQVKPLSAFSKCAQRKDGLQFKCKQCDSKDRQKPKRKLKQRIAQFKRSVNAEFTLFDYLQLLNSQNGRCAICGRTNTNGKNLAIDHNHKSGQIRGLLCEHCNFGLGLFGDDVRILERAIDYLKSNS